MNGPWNQRHEHPMIRQKREEYELLKRTVAAIAAKLGVDTNAQRPVNPADASYARRVMEHAAQYAMPIRDSEEQSVYNSTTQGAIPLSIKGRYLLQDLREALQKVVTDGWVPKLANARAAIAKRMGSLEATVRDLRVEIAKQAADAAQLREAAGNYAAEAANLRHQNENQRVTINSLRDELMSIGSDVIVTSSPFFGPKKRHNVRGVRRDEDGTMTVTIDG